MIYIPAEQSNQVQYLLESSLLGHHLLFDLEELKTTLLESAPLSAEQAYAVEPHLEQLLGLAGSGVEVRAYLDRLEPLTRSRVIQTYFSLLDHQLLERGHPPH